MIDKHKNSKNIQAQLAAAIGHMRRQEAIVVELENGKKTGIYPAEFLQGKATLTKSKTLIRIAKRAGLLPALAVMPVDKSLPVFSEAMLKEALEQSGNVFETARSKLPMDGAEDSTVVSFRVEGDEVVHLALLIGKKKAGAVPLVRVHSSCVTGDLLGSLRCDCGSQLRLAIEEIKNAGYGALLYMNQEGRGIGITNKIRAYDLQEKGMDTYEANHALGFEGDERDFSAAASILKSLGMKKINLLSNNPHKVSELRVNGITIAKRLPLVIKSGKHNKAYIAAKAKKAGHIL